MNETTIDPRAVRAAAFLAQALDLDDGLDPAAFAAGLARLKHDPHAAIYAAELDSSVGPAAFLIYVYDFAANGPDGRSGRDLFDADLAVLDTAAERDVPGPRLVAHATGDAEGYILATTPATLRALRGEAPTDATDSPAAGPNDPLPAGSPAEARQAGAAELLRLLALANAEAERWLAALQADGWLHADSDDADRSPAIAFNDAETELALFLLDERSIRSLLRAINLLLTTAQAEASQALGRDHAGDG